MSTTKTFTNTFQEALEQANPNFLADVLRLLALGNFFAWIKVTFAGLTSAAAVDITTAASLSKATIVGWATDEVNAALPPIGNVQALRVTAGAAAAGARFITDAGGTPSSTVATISDDGKTLTFESTVTGFVLEYQPRPAHAMTDIWQNF